MSDWLDVACAQHKAATTRKAGKLLREFKLEAMDAAALQRKGWPTPSARTLDQGRRYVIGVLFKRHGRVRVLKKMHLIERILAKVEQEERDRPDMILRSLW